MSLSPRHVVRWTVLPLLSCVLAGVGITAAEGATTSDPLVEKADCQAMGGVWDDEACLLKARTLDGPVPAPTTAPVPGPTTEPVPAPAPTTARVPAPSEALLTESFTGADGVFVSQDAFWKTADLGVAENATWLAESGQVFRRGSAGETDSSVMRMWTRRTDLAFTTAEMDVRFNGWNGGSSGWHGINLWMNETFCTPAPGCTRLQDGATSEGPSGYALDFMNRDGSLTILKKVAGDTRGTWAGAVSYSNGGTYYQLAKTTWTPTVGQTYRWAGRVVDNGDGSTTLQVLVDGRVLLAVVDDARVGGPRLTGGRVGLRSDYADLTVDDLTIRR